MGRNKTVDDEELLRVAREVFGAGGHTATTRDVARAAGISQAVLYQRFGSKEDLFLRAMMPEAPDIEALLGPYPPRSAKDQVRQIAERLVAFFGDLLPTLLHVHAHPDLGPVHLQDWHARLPFASILHGLSQRLAKLRADGLISAVNTEAAAHTLVAAAHGLALFQTTFAGAQSHGHGHGSAANIDQLMDVIWTGLAPSSGATPPRRKR